MLEETRTHNTRYAVENVNIKPAKYRQKARNEISQHVFTYPCEKSMCVSTEDEQNYSMNVDLYVTHNLLGTFLQLIFIINIKYPVYSLGAGVG